MKKIYILTLALIGISSVVKAQTPCDQGRYYTEVYPNVTVTSDITFGSNTSFAGVPTTLMMDIYEPTGDTATARPLIIWAHGGSFIGGSRTDGDVVALSNEFAKKGFVCASIDYRLGMFPIDSVNAVKAVLRSVQDMRAATRYFYMDKSTTDTYKIDTNVIIIGGSSAGAITALHMAYLDKDCEIETYMSASDLATLGGFEGESGNPGYSSDVHAVVSLAGALASYGWIESGDIPYCAMQGDQDNVVPYDHGIASVSGFNVIGMDGSQMLKTQADVVGVENSTYTHYGAGHSPYAAGGAYMDTTFNFVTDFLVDLVGCSEPVLQPENAITGTPVLYPLAYCGLGLNEGNLSASISVYPNPAEDYITVSIDNETAIETIELLDLSGRLIQSYQVTSNETTIQRNQLGAGSYILKITNSEGQSATSKVIFN